MGAGLIRAIRRGGPGVSGPGQRIRMVFTAQRGRTGRPILEESDGPGVLEASPSLGLRSTMGAMVGTFPASPPIPMLALGLGDGPRRGRRSEGSFCFVDDGPLDSSPKLPSHPTWSGQAKPWSSPDRPCVPCLNPREPSPVTLSVFKHRATG